MRIRTATISDASVIAQVICMGFGEDMMQQYCGENGQAVIEEIAKMEVSQYSYHNALIAEVDRQPVGAIVGYDGARLLELRAPTLAYIHSQTGFIPDVEDEAEPDEFYFDTLAVFPEYRHQGIGRKLLLALCEKAFREGYQRLGLLVDTGNPQAECLYSSLGFHRVKLKNLLTHQLWHMQKERDANIIM